MRGRFLRLGEGFYKYLIVAIFLFDTLNSNTIISEFSQFFHFVSIDDLTR